MRTPLFLALASLSAADLAAAPRYRMKMSGTDATQGVNLVSIVADPAIARGFVALSALKTAPKRVHLSTEPSQQVLTGPALVPEEEILRVDAKGKPYYISFSAEEISQIKRRYALNGYQKLSNHEHKTPLDSIVFDESWIVTQSDNDKASALGLDVPVGTWMLSGHIADADFWQKEVLTGNVTGFSIEGLFDLEEVTLAALPASPIKMKKTFFQRLGAAGLALLGLSAVALKDGSQVDVADDGTVSLLDANGNITGPAPDGNYKPKDGEAFDVKDGMKVVAMAADPPAADKPAADAGDPATAKKELEAAIALHKKHMDGTAPTDEASQKAMMDLMEKALAALAGTAAAPADTKMSAVEIKAAAVELLLEAVEMLDGSQLTYNPISRLLSDANGVPVPSGYHACKDGSFFRVETSQYTYTIDAETYAKATTQLAAVKVDLAAANELLSKTPGGQKLLLGAEGGGKSSEPEPAQGWVAVALARAKELKGEATN